MGAQTGDEMRASPRLTFLATVVVVLLLLAAATGLGRGGSDEMPSGPLDFSHASGWGWAAVMSLLWLGAATLVTARTRPDGSHRGAFRSALTLHVVLCLIAAALTIAAPVGLGAARSIGSGAPRLDRSDWRDVFGFSLPDWLLEAVLAVIAVLLIASTAFLAWAVWGNRHVFFRERGRRHRETRYGHGADVAAEAQRVYEALHRARRALAGDDDARQAIIAAYAAMEDAVVSQGVLRRPTQTPTEVIRAALAAGILTAADSAARLLEVFHTARFSSAPVDAAHVATADSALAELQQDLLQRTGRG